MTLLYVAGAIGVLFATGLLVVRLRVPLGAALKTDAEIAQAAREGRWHLALKSYRELHGVGLKKAKEAVNELVATSAKAASEIDPNRR